MNLTWKIVLVDNIICLVILSIATLIYPILVF